MIKWKPVIVTRISPVAVALISLIISSVSQSSDPLLVGGLAALFLWIKGDTILSLYDRLVGVVLLSDARTTKEVPANTEDKDMAPIIIMPTERDEEVIQGEPIEAGALQIGEDAKGNAVVLQRPTALAVAGQQGTGKTVTAVSIAVALIKTFKGNVKFLVIDPHARASKEALAQRMAPLRPFLLSPAIAPNPVVDTADLLKWLDWVVEEMARRLQGGEGSWTQNLVIIVDEFNSYLDDTAQGYDPEVFKRFSKVLENVNAQARKVGMFAIVIANVIKASKVNTDLRSTITSFIIHRMPAAAARQILPTTQDKIANTAPALRDKTALAYINGEVMLTQIHMPTDAELQNIVESYATPIPLKGASRPEEAVDTPLPTPTGKTDHDLYIMYNGMVQAGLIPETATQLIAEWFFGGYYDEAIASIEHGYSIDIEESK